MLEGKELILATKKYAYDEPAKSWYHTLSTLVLLILSITCALYPFHVMVRLFFSLLTALLLVRIFVIYHDFLHFTILRKSRIARYLFTFIGLYMLNPPNIWKRSHDYHHKHNSKLSTSSIGSFPIVTREKFYHLSQKQQTLYLLTRHPIVIAMGYIFMFIWGMCIKSLLRNPAKHWDSAVALLVHFGIGLSILWMLGWTAFLLGFLLPAIISSAIGSYLFYAQHNFPSATFQNKDGWTYVGAAMESSSYMKMGSVMRWFTGNIGYHHIHHINARIPFYRLPEVYEAFPEFQQAKTTSLHPSDIAKCLELKVWDPASNKMLTRKEMLNYATRSVVW